MYKFFQNLGRSLMLPVAILPAAAIIAGIGNTLNALHATPKIAMFFTTVGTTILEQLGILFAIGVAIGMAKKNDGVVALAATFGIVIGLIAAYAYNKFSETELPLALSFFSGKRLVPIMTAFYCTFLVVILLFLWPLLYSWIVKFGESIVGLGSFGAFIYGVANRLLIPTGLHHALNSVFWFDTIGINDIGKFQSGKDAIKGITGRYQAGFFPIMMFGIPAAALAMYHTAKTTQKKQVYGWFLASSVAAFFVGVTEPIEFAFMFVAPILYVVHALLTGLSLFIAATFHWTAGFSFSAGLIDYVLSLINPVSNHPLMLLVQGVVFFILYYVIFRVVIQVFNLNTIGRGENELVDPTVVKDNIAPGENDIKQSKYHQHAIQILEGLGGQENIVNLTNCATRLRLELKDTSIIDKQKIKNAGAVGVTVNGKHSTQVIVGTHVQQVADEIEKHL
ncbi:N-acetylglucosamine-specific PTS transporter subunit IIBC [Staphylococcus aureus]|nr:N-acetylglucosamine-specific PTS transporter subunit IIBC [Staphylococcus aureus]